MPGVHENMLLWDGLLLCVCALSHQDFTGRQQSCGARNRLLGSWCLLPCGLHPTPIPFPDFALASSAVVKQRAM